MPDESLLHERVTQLEMVFMHLEQTVRTLDEVVRSQQKVLDVLSARVAALAKPTPLADDDDLASDSAH